MLRFFEFLQERTLDEGNKLFKNVQQPLSQGKKIGTVSAERWTRTPRENREKDKNLKSDLARLRSKGAIGGYKSATGRYIDQETNKLGKEKSYVVRQGEGNKRKHFDKILKALGKRYDQESTMHVKSNKEAEYRFKDKKEVDPQGKVVYNKPLVRGGGDTSFRGKQSFTTTGK